MNIDEKKEKEIWRSWLDDKHGEKLDKLRTAVTEIYYRNNSSSGDLPFFTPHGPEHCRAVELLIHKLIPGDKHNELTTKEKFYLLASAWVHDLGMLPYVASKIYENEWPIDEQEVRKRHHITSDRYIVDNWYELKIDETDKEILGKLSRFHRRAEDLNDCEYEFIVENEKIRLRLLACYLRLADSLDISASRTPAEHYAVCLVYDMPDDSKLHWIKSRLVNGVYPDAKNNTIQIQLKYPNRDELKDIIDQNSAIEKLDSITKLVIDDLRDELSSVINVITREGIAYYLDIIPIKSSVGLDRRMLNDLRELVMNFDIVVAPSASKLLEIMLIAFGNILGYSFSKDTPPSPFVKAQKRDIHDLKTKLENFLKAIKEKILSVRPCHLGLKVLIDECQKQIDNLEREGEKGLENFVLFLNKCFQVHHESRKLVRTQSTNLFKEKFNHIIVKESAELKFNYAELPTSSTINILLYGYSELVTKTICGLRDSIITSSYNCENIDPKKLFNSAVEKQISKLIKLFICEGHPKTKTGFNDRLVYHDGSQYALYLQSRGFFDINVIPDITAGTIIEKAPIDFFILGANGISKKGFLHSAGHCSIVKLAHFRRDFQVRPLTTILVATTEKALFNNDINLSSTTSDNPKYYDIEGCRYVHYPNFSPNRNNIWMSRDKVLLKKLHDSEKISFLNPREELVPYDMIDYVITEKGWCQIKKDDYQWLTDLFKIDITKKTSTTTT